MTDEELSKEIAIAVEHLDVLLGKADNRKLKTYVTINSISNQDNPTYLYELRIIRVVKSLWDINTEILKREEVEPCEAPSNTKK